MRNPYARSSAPSSDATIYPGMNESAEEANRPEAKVESCRPVIGFLYSVSRTAAGEYWPLKIGNNVIGRSSDCDICLQEMTVSAKHAVLNIRQMKTTKQLLVSLDVTGTNGGFVNDQEVGLERMECKDGDFITIGDNYVLYLIIVDANKLGLKVSEGFKATSEAGRIPDDGGFDYNQHTEDMYSSVGRAEGGTRTMNLDGSSDSTKPTFNTEGFTNIL